MNPWRSDPGPCIVCGKAHSTCCTSPGPIAVVQTPARDAAAAREREQLELEQPAPALQAERVQATLPPGQFTTGTYRRANPRGRTKGGTTEARHAAANAAPAADQPGSGSTTPQPRIEQNEKHNAAVDTLQRMPNGPTSQDRMTAGGPARTTTRGTKRGVTP